MKLKDIMNEDGTLCIELVAAPLAYEPIEIQREFLQLYFDSVKSQTYSKKHFEALFTTLLSENGTDFKNALKCGL